jgi:hypothetical protein
MNEGVPRFSKDVAGKFGTCTEHGAPGMGHGGGQRRMLTKESLYRRRKTQQWYTARK